MLDKKGYKISLRHWFEKGERDCVFCRELSDGKWALFDKNGNRFGVSFASFRQSSFVSGLWAVQPEKDGLYGFIDTTGELVIPPKFDGDTMFRQYHCDRMVYDGKVYDKCGDVVVDLAVKYDDWYDNYTDGYLLVATRNIPQGELCDDDLAWGYLDINGNEVIPCKYHSANPFRCGRAVVEEMKWRRAKAYGGKLACTDYDGYGVIDEKGNQIIPCKYRYIGFFYGSEDFYKGEINTPSEMLYKVVRSWRPRNECVMDGNGDIVPIMLEDIPF